MAMQVELSGSVSSQYLTALLMAAPLATGTSGIDIRITDELVSQPYVDMTVRLMERFGVTVSHAWAARVPCMWMYITFIWRAAAVLQGLASSVHSDIASLCL